MAKETVTIDLDVEGGKEVERALDKISGKLDDVGKAQKDIGNESKKSSESAGAGFASIAGKAALAAGAVIGIVAAVKGLSESLETNIGIVNRFTGDLSQARKMTGGLASDLELMKTANITATAGYQLSSKELGIMQQTLIETSSAFGDNVIGANEMAEAIAKGEAGPLEKLGLRLDSNSTLAERQAQTFQFLEEKYATNASGADTLGGKLAVLENAASNTWLSFLEGIDNGIDLEGVFDDLGEEVGFTQRDFRDLATFIGGTLAAVFSNAIKLAVALGKEISNLIKGNFSELGKAIMGTNFADPFEVGAQAVEKAAQKAAEAAQKGEEIRKNGMRAIRRDLPEVEKEAKKTVEKVEEEFEPLTNIKIRLSPEVVMEQAERAKERILKLQADTLAEIKKREKEEAEAAFAETEALQQEAVAKGEEAAGAAVMATKLVLGERKEAAVVENTIAAATETAKAVAAYPDVLGMATHGLAAALHVKAAIAAGGSASGGGGGGAPKIAPRGNQARPVPSNGGGGGEGGTTIVNINSPVPRDQVGLMTLKAQRASQRRYGK